MESVGGVSGWEWGMVGWVKGRGWGWGRGGGGAQEGRRIGRRTLTWLGGVGDEQVRCTRRFFSKDLRNLPSRNINNQPPVSSSSTPDNRSTHTQTIKSSNLSLENPLFHSPCLNKFLFRQISSSVVSFASRHFFLASSVLALASRPMPATSMPVKKQDLSLRGARRRKSRFRAALFLGSSGLSGWGFLEGVGLGEAWDGGAGDGFAGGAGWGA